MRTKYTPEKAMLVFDEARKLFLGSKRGLKTEFSNFVWRSKHPLAGKPKFVVAEILPLLKPAIERQIVWRQADGRYWKNFQTWINQLYWEEEIATVSVKSSTPPLQSAVCVVDHNPAVAYDLVAPGRPIFLCRTCVRAIGKVHWGRMSLSAIEKAVEKGKRRLPKKDLELVASEDKQKAIAKLRQDLGKSMKP